MADTYVCKRCGATGTKKEIPYKISMKAPEPSDELKAALKEADDIASGKIKSKGYHNVRQMIEDILNED